jgi:tRNA(fMet)-specific endonuclease VapC
VAGNKYLLDTNAVIALQKNEAAMITLLAAAEEVFVPSIVIGELYFGAYKSARSEDNRKAVETFTAGRVVLIPDADTADMYGQIKYALRIKGRPIPENDIWIAALAMQHDLVLLTKDQHFAEVDNLSVTQW